MVWVADRFYFIAYIKIDIFGINSNMYFFYHKHSHERVMVTSYSMRHVCIHVKNMNYLCHILSTLCIYISKVNPVSQQNICCNITACKLSASFTANC